MKKIISLIMCGAMLLTSTNVFAKMIGYHPADFERQTYYFEGHTEPASVNDTEYLTVSNVRSFRFDNTYEQGWKDMYAEEETTVTVTKPIDQLWVVYYGENPGIDETTMLIEEKNVAAGTTYTFKDKGLYELLCNNKSAAMVEIVSPDHYSIEGIKNEQMIIDNPSHYIPVYGESEATPAVSETPVVQDSVIANPTDSEIVIGKGAWMLDAYNINDNNYFKLRDIAFAFTYEGEKRPFEVTWDGEKNAINLISNTKYTAVGGECGGYIVETDEWPEPDWDAIMNGTVNVKPQKEAKPTTSEIYIDGVKVNLTAYNIDDNNYFKLRDLAEALDFEVVWNGEENRIYVSTYGSYIPE